MGGLLDGGLIAITDEGTGIARALAKKMKSQGLRAEVVSEVPAEASSVIFLGGLSKVKTTNEALSINRDAFHAAKAVAKTFTEKGGLFVTVQDTGGDFGLSGNERASC